MTIACLMPVRNEDWILGLTARAAMKWADYLVLLDHCSTDQSHAIEIELVGEYPGRVLLMSETNPEWQEMRHRQALLETARVLKATHIAMVDADEILTADLLPSIRKLVEETPKDSVLQLPWLCLRGSIDHYHSRGVWAQQDVSMAFKDSPAYHWAARDGYDFHHRHPMGAVLRQHRPLRPAGFLPASGGLMHLQFVSDRRLRAKQALYKLTELLRWPGREPVDTVNRRYNVAVYGSDTKSDQWATGLAGTPSTWWEAYTDLMSYLTPDREPWQETECKRLLAEHGRERFAGLDLFGVA